MEQRHENCLIACSLPRNAPDIVAADAEIGQIAVRHRLKLVESAPIPLPAAIVV
jgi:hypothetical protein